ncbi:hypothetical protein CBOM_05406 [Ceraceosorus bombacis]|uniref:Uncharacterized protein n=1 Tax=Ceraceosorus bombacis TaxID=401625 RepID=A0A0P1BPE7_9BASI|nr:hypothetical protein CBOM_05406 [Ceraceosorus bombacis]
MERRAEQPRQQRGRLLSFFVGACKYSLLMPLIAAARVTELACSCEIDYCAPADSNPEPRCCLMLIRDALRIVTTLCAVFFVLENTAQRPLKKNDSSCTPSKDLKRVPDESFGKDGNPRMQRPQGTMDQDKIQDTMISWLFNLDFAASLDSKSESAFLYAGIESAQQLNETWPDAAPSPIKSLYFAELIYRIYHTHDDTPSRHCSILDIQCNLLLNHAFASQQGEVTASMSHTSAAADGIDPASIQQQKKARVWGEQEAAGNDESSHEAARHEEGRAIEGQNEAEGNDYSARRPRRSQRLAARQV